jgi:hypothetical protein
MISQYGHANALAHPEHIPLAAIVHQQSVLPPETMTPFDKIRQFFGSD